MTINSVRLLKTVDITAPTNPTTNYALVLEFADMHERDQFVAAEQNIGVNAQPPLHARPVRNPRCAIITLPKSDSNTNVHQDTLDALVAYLVTKFPESDKFAEIAIVEEQWSALSRDRTRSIIDTEVSPQAEQQTAAPTTPAPISATTTPAPTNLAPTSEVTAPAPTTPAPTSATTTPASTNPAPTSATTTPAPTNAEPTTAPQQNSSGYSFSGLVNSARARLPSMPHFSQYTEQLSVANLRARVQNWGLRLPTMDEIKQKAQSFIQAPSRHPITLALVVSTASFFAGLSFIGMGIVGVGVYGGTKLREHLYSQPMVSPTENNNVPVESTDAFNAGRDAAAGWTSYFESCKSKNNWINVISYGKGLKQKMDEIERDTQGHRLGQ